jgi:hypothetical protein
MSTKRALHDDDDVVVVAIVTATDRAKRAKINATNLAAEDEQEHAPLVVSWVALAAAAAAAATATTLFLRRTG